MTWVGSAGITSRISGLNAEFQSPSFIARGQSFSYTFTNAGFFVSQQSFDSFRRPAYGTINVLQVRDNLPKVTMNSPVEEYYFSDFSDVPLLASVNISNTVKQVEFFANGASVGLVTNFPYRVDWRNYTAGRFAIFARATDAADQSIDSAPVTINVISNSLITAPRMLASGHFVFQYVIRRASITLVRSFDVTRRPECWPITGGSSYQGTFVEPATNQYTFYLPLHCP